MSVANLNAALAYLERITEAAQLLANPDPYTRGQAAGRIRSHTISARCEVRNAKRDLERLEDDLREQAAELRALEAQS